MKIKKAQSVWLILACIAATGLIGCGKTDETSEKHEAVTFMAPYMDVDSFIAVSYTHLADKIKISLSKKENSMELLLADNGVGIEKEDLKHIFERLYKCDKGRSEKGSGLGLSIVHQLVEKMGGSIAVESIPGKGTEFSLRFPLEI